MRAAPREITFSRPSPDLLCVHLSGSWTLAGGLPSGEGVRQEIDSSRPRRLAFDSSALAAWDSALPAFLRGPIEFADNRGVEVDRSGLPTGVVRLLALAAAVPEQGSRDDTLEPWLAHLGHGTVAMGDAIVNNVAFVGQVTSALAKVPLGRARFRGSDFALIVQQCGAEALPIVGIVSFLVGMIFAFVGAVQLEQFGAQIFVADLVGLGMAREMGAMMTAIIMAGRTGASFAAHLGSMAVNEEIDALETMGLSAIEFLVLPRMMALVLMMPLLCLYSDLLGIVGGAFVGVSMLDVGWISYFDETRKALDVADFGAGLIRATVYGALVALSGCLRGMQCGRSAAGVGAATTSSVVTAIVLIVIASGIINVLDHVTG